MLNWQKLEKTCRFNHCGTETSDRTEIRNSLFLFSMVQFNPS